MPRNELTWRVFPARDKRKLAVFLLVVVAFLSIVFYTSGVFWTVFAAVILALSLSSFFTPTTYTMDDEKVTIKRPLYSITRRWDNVRRVTVHKNGVFLSPFRKRTRMENFRGVFLIVRDNMDDVVNFIRERAGEGVFFPDSDLAKPHKPEEG